MCAQSWNIILAAGCIQRAFQLTSVPALSNSKALLEHLASHSSSSGRSLLCQCLKFPQRYFLIASRLNTGTLTWAIWVFLFRVFCFAIKIEVFSAFQFISARLKRFYPNSMMISFDLLPTKGTLKSGSKEKAPLVSLTKCPSESGPGSRDFGKNMDSPHFKKWPLEGAGLSISSSKIQVKNRIVKCLKWPLNTKKK